MKGCYLTGATGLRLGHQNNYFIQGAQTGHLNNNFIIFKKNKYGVNFHKAAMQHNVVSLRRSGKLSFQFSLNSWQSQTRLKIVSNKELKKPQSCGGQLYLLSAYRPHSNEGKPEVWWQNVRISFDGDGASVGTRERLSRIFFVRLSSCSRNMSHFSLLIILPD